MAGKKDGAIEKALATVDTDRVRYSMAFEDAFLRQGTDFERLESFITTLPMRKGKPAQPQVLDGETPHNLNENYLFNLNLALEALDGSIFSEVEAVALRLGLVFKPGPAKLNKRCYEKARLCYNGDLSRLSDLRRASVLCPTVAALLELLRALSVTAGIEILRVKNRFSRDYDATSESGGYRDLQLNVRVGGTGLIWELQLHLEVIEELKKSTGTSGHARYVIFRAMLERIKQGKQQNSNATVMRMPMPMPMQSKYLSTICL